MKKDYRFYKSTLSLAEQQVYGTVCDGITLARQQIFLGDVPVAHLSDIVQAVIQDNVLLYNVDGFSYRYRGRDRDVQLFPTYVHGISEYMATDGRLKHAANKLAQESQRGNDYATVLALHDALCRMIIYKKTGFFAHNIVGSLLHREAVCDGISKAFKLCCDYLGIACIVVFGNARPSYESREFEKHAWNKVRIDYKWYNVDVTFDLGISESDFVRHDYFLVADNEISQSHRPEDRTFPCAQPSNYHMRNMLLMRNLRDFEDLIVNRCSTGRNLRCEVKFAMINPAEMHNKVMQTVQAAMDRLTRGCHVSFSVNPEMLTVFISVTFN